MRAENGRMILPAIQDVNEGYYVSDVSNWNFLSFTYDFWNLPARFGPVPQFLMNKQRFANIFEIVIRVTPFARSSLLRWRTYG